jgi:hypothetical protein
MATKQKLKFVEVVAPRPKTQTEMARRIRSFSFSDAMLAVEWLNTAQHTAAYKRVIAFRRELEELGAILDTLTTQKRLLKDKRIASLKKQHREDKEILDSMQKSVTAVEQQDQFRVRHNALNQLLARYTHVPAFAYNLDSGFWRFAMLPKRPRGPQITVSDEVFHVRVNESTVIDALARLAANRELYKVRLCETCLKRWRVSERKIDRFCSQQCRDAFHVKSPGYHERKAANQRKYRAGLKELHARGLA